jgi:hypothetical protein
MPGSGKRADERVPKLHEVAVAEAVVFELDLCVRR